MGSKRLVEHSAPVNKGFIIVSQPPSCNGYKKLYLRDKFFDDDLIVKEYHNKIVFTKPTIDYNGKTIHPSKAYSTYYYTQLAIGIDPGKYPIDPDESNEDVIVVYKEDKIV